MAPDQVKRLVENFSEHYTSYKNSSYNETQLRREFLDPLFEALGWDVNNHEGFAEAYKDVIHEDSIKIGGVAKAPDYGFRIGGVKKFFVEAKKPAVNLNSDPKPAFQLKRYAWSAKLPISILSDFEEFIIYDTRNKPNQSDPAVKSRIDYFKYTDYLTRWDEIYSVFSKEAILKGSFDKFIEDKKLKHGTNEVDDEFLKEIDKWRDSLAKDLAINNNSSTIRELNFAVQKTIDRIIFLRICEDRGIEDYGKLQKLTSGKDIYKRLVEIFSHADQKYNSGLFHFQEEKGITEAPDTITPKLEISDYVLRDILKNLYYPDSPYEFSVLPGDVLGHVYEQFLGKVIRLEDHKAIVEEKPEVKKAGGVYYTPTFIVDYIVKNTVGKFLDGKTPKQTEKIKILDPACGSGSFLLGAYQYLLDWHRDYYTNNLSEKFYKGKNPIIFQFRENDWRLTTAEKKRILLNNIFGVDIDSQAVEVTKLSLLLKVLEGESQETLHKQLGLFHERALPDLSSNVKCGNSVVSSDFDEVAQEALFDLEEKIKINTFNWESEFSEIMQAGGFDVVIGNPPYIRIQNLQEFSPEQVSYLKKQYKSASSGNYDIYVVFVEKGLELLNKKGHLGFILPNKFFNAQYGAPLRSLISKGKYLEHIVHFSDKQVFKGATTYTALLFLNKTGSNYLNFVRVNDLNSWQKGDNQSSENINSVSLTSSDWNFASGEDAQLFEKLRNMPIKLSDVAERIFQGLVTGADKVFILKAQGNDVYYSEATNRKYSIEPQLMHPLCKGSVNLKRYHITQLTKSILFPYKLVSGKAELITVKEFENEYPKAWKYLLENKKTLESREHDKWKHGRWYAFGRSQNLSEMEQVKILTPSIANKASFSLDLKNFLYFIGSGGGGGGGYGITLKPKERMKYEYILGLLNSNLLDALLKSFSSRFSGGYYAYNRQYIEQLPIHRINFSNSIEKDQHDQIVKLVKQISDLYKQFQTTKTDYEQNTIKRQIENADKFLNDLIYALYGLTSSEIEILTEPKSP